jgi:CheY-like chemotaxis protein
VACSPEASRRLLYVEDDRVAALLFTEALRTVSGLEIELAETGAEALVLAASWQPGLLVLDAHLPDMGAAELLPRLRALPGLADVPVYLCSADAAPEPAMATQITGYWPKPVQRERLLADLQAWLQA